MKMRSPPAKTGSATCDTPLLVYSVAPPSSVFTSQQAFSSLVTNSMNPSTSPPFI
jgi:hypothetical protein